MRKHEIEKLKYEFDKLHRDAELKQDEHKVYWSVDNSTNTTTADYVVSYTVGEIVMFLEDQKNHRLMPELFKCRLTRSTLRKKIDELNEKIKKFAEGSSNDNDVAFSMTWFTLRNIPIIYIQFEGIKILDDEVEHRLIPMDDEAILAALNEYYSEHKSEYSFIPENHPTKRMVRRMKGLLESKGYSIRVDNGKVDNVFYIDGAE